MNISNDGLILQDEQQQLCRFFVVGDPGKEGPQRKDVGEALARLQAGWRASRQPTAAFAVSTGDNIYGAASDRAFHQFSADFLDKAPVPWLMALGNHDISPAKLRWHLSRHGLSGSPSTSPSIITSSSLINSSLINSSLINSSLINSSLVNSSLINSSLITSTSIPNSSLDSDRNHPPSPVVLPHAGSADSPGLRHTAHYDSPHSPLSDSITCTPSSSTSVVPPLSDSPQPPSLSAPLFLTDAIVASTSIHPTILNPIIEADSSCSPPPPHISSASLHQHPQVLVPAGRAFAQPPPHAPEWRWVCPAPAYRGNDFLSAQQCPPGLLEVFVINTNKLSKALPRAALGPAPGFYTARDAQWWKQQKESLRRRLAASPARWKVVVGHHPCEFVPCSVLEHRTPLVRYFAATFMRGGRKSRARRQGLSHVIGRQADLYLCGHQHLLASLSLDPRGAALPPDECRCHFAIVGASSQLDDDPATSDDEGEGDTSASRNGNGNGDGDEREEEDGGRDGDGQMKMGNERGEEILYSQDLVPQKVSRYRTEFVAPPANGFFVIDAAQSQLVVRCFCLKGKRPVELYRHTILKD